MGVVFKDDVQPQQAITEATGGNRLSLSSLDSSRNGFPTSVSTWWFGGFVLASICVLILPCDIWHAIRQSRTMATRGLGRHTSVAVV